MLSFEKEGKKWEKKKNSGGCQEDVNKIMMAPAATALEDSIAIGFPLKSLLLKPSSS